MIVEMDGKGKYRNEGMCPALLAERSLVCLATTYSPAFAVPSALERFTAEFGMGSGGGAPP